MHLHDLEEISLKCDDEDDREIVRDCISAYHAGVGRAVATLMYVVVFNNIYRKLISIKDFNSDARHICEKISTTYEATGVMETSISDLVAKHGITDDEQNIYLSTLKSWRNKVSHIPSPEPSSELCRYLISDGVTLFLSHEHLNLKWVADDIIERIVGGDFAALQSNPRHIDTAICKAEMIKLDSDSIKYLLAQLAQRYFKVEDWDVKNTIVFFMGTAASTFNAENFVKFYYKKVIRVFVSRSARPYDTVSLINYSPECLSYLQIEDHIRLAVLMSATINSEIENGPNVALHAIGHIFDVSPRYSEVYLQAIGHLALLIGANEQIHKITNHSRSMDRMVARGVISHFTSGEFESDVSDLSGLFNLHATNPDVFSSCVVLYAIFGVLINNEDMNFENTFPSGKLKDDMHSIISRRSKSPSFLYRHMRGWFGENRMSYTDFLQIYTKLIDILAKEAI